MAKSLLCYVRLHRWVRKRSVDGQFYNECRKCGKFEDITAHKPPWLGAPS
jgi:hypothetical protein